MTVTRLRILAALLISMSILPVFAQTRSSQETGASLDQIRRLRAQTAEDRNLPDDLRSQVLDLYDHAISSLEKAADNRAATAAFDRDRAGIDRDVARLREELEKPERTPRLSLPEDPTVAQAEDALTRERARLAANRSALRNQERIAEDRAKTRNDISKRLGELDLEIELLNDELRRQAETTARTELKAAARQSLLARQEGRFVGDRAAPRQAHSPRRPQFAGPPRNRPRPTPGRLQPGDGRDARGRDPR